MFYSHVYLTRMYYSKKSLQSRKIKDGKWFIDTRAIYHLFHKKTNNKKQKNIESLSFIKNIIHLEDVTILPIYNKGNVEISMINAKIIHFINVRLCLQSNITIHFQFVTIMNQDNVCFRTLDVSDRHIRMTNGRLLVHF